LNIGEHRQAAKRAAADIEGHSTAAEHGQPGRLSARVNVCASEMKEAANCGGLSEIRSGILLRRR
jgi:hypothetical protein